MSSQLPELGTYLIEEDERLGQDLDQMNNNLRLLLTGISELKADFIKQFSHDQQAGSFALKFDPYMSSLETFMLQFA